MISTKPIVTNTSLNFKSTNQPTNSIQLKQAIEESRQANPEQFKNYSDKNYEYIDNKQQIKQESPITPVVQTQTKITPITPVVQTQTKTPTVKQGTMLNIIKSKQPDLNMVSPYLKLQPIKITPNNQMGAHIQNRLPSSKVTSIPESLNTYWSGINPNSVENKAIYTSRSGEAVLGPSALDTALTFALGGPVIVNVGKIIAKEVVKKEVPSIVKGVVVGITPSTKIVKTTGGESIAVIVEKDKVKNIVAQQGLDKVVLTKIGKPPIKPTGNVEKKIESYIGGVKFGQKIIGKKPVIINQQNIAKSTGVTPSKNNIVVNKFNYQEIIKPTTVISSVSPQLQQMETFYSFQAEGQQGPWFSKQLYPSYAANISIRNPSTNINIWELTVPKSIADKYNANTMSQPFRQGKTVANNQGDIPLNKFDSRVTSVQQRRDLFTGKMKTIDPDAPIGKYVYERTHYKPLTVANEWVFPVDIVKQFGKKVATSNKPINFINTIKKSGSTENKIKKTVPHISTNQEKFVGSQWYNVLKIANKKTRLPDKTIKKGGKLSAVKNNKALEEMITFSSIQGENNRGPWFLANQPTGLGADPFYLSKNVVDHDTHSDIIQVTIPKHIAEQYRVDNLSRQFKEGYIRKNGSIFPPRGYRLLSDESLKSTLKPKDETHLGHAKWSDYYHTTPEQQSKLDDKNFVNSNIIYGIFKDKLNTSVGRTVGEASYIPNIEYAFPKNIVKSGKVVANSRNPRKFIDVMISSGRSKEDIITLLKDPTSYSSAIEEPSISRTILDILQKRDRLPNTGRVPGVAVGLPPKKVPILPQPKKSILDKKNKQFVGITTIGGLGAFGGAQQAHADSGYFQLQPHSDSNYTNYIPDTGTFNTLNPFDPAVNPFSDTQMIKRVKQGINSFLNPFPDAYGFPFAPVIKSTVKTIVEPVTKKPVNWTKYNKQLEANKKYYQKRQQATKGDSYEVRNYNKKTNEWKPRRLTRFGVPSVIKPHD